MSARLRGLYCGLQVTRSLLSQRDRLLEDDWTQQAEQMAGGNQFQKSSLCIQSAATSPTIVTLDAFALDGRKRSASCGMEFLPL